VARDEELFTAIEGPALRRFGPEWQGTSLVSADGRAHRRLRNLVHRGFTPRMIGRLEEQIRTRARAIVAGLLERGECEFAHDAACALPMHMIADIVGIPESDRAYVFERVDGYMIAGDPEIAITPEQKSAMEREIFEYGVALAARKRADPGDDVWSILTRAELPDDEGGGASQLSDFELALFFHVLALAGEKIAAGERVSIWIASANRDESVFAAPDRFDITRDPNPHVAFGGGGAHYCLGSHLAQHQVRVLFEELLAAARAIEPTGAPHWTVSGLHNNVPCSLGHVPIRVAA